MPPVVIVGDNVYMDGAMDWPSVHRSNSSSDEKVAITTFFIAAILSRDSV